MKTKRKIISVWSDDCADYVYKLQRHVNYSWLKYFGSKGWWVTDATSSFRETAVGWASHYIIKINPPS